MFVDCFFSITSEDCLVSKESLSLAISCHLALVYPVPAGIRRPTITFSFNPSSVSTLPLIAASVSTRVVSWNEAAEINEFVWRDALVIPSKILSPVAIFLFSFYNFSFMLDNFILSTISPNK